MSIATSVRYQRLLKVLTKVLTQTRSQLDIESCVKDCYGDDALIFNEHDSNALKTLFETMLDQVQEEALEGMKQSLQKIKVERILQLVETIIHQLHEQERMNLAAEQESKTATLFALQQVLLPQGVKMEDLITYKMYQQMNKERDLLSQQIEAVENETNVIEAEIKNRTAVTETHLANLQGTSEQLEKLADVCSMVS